MPFLRKFDQISYLSEGYDIDAIQILDISGIIFRKKLFANF